MVVEAVAGQLGNWRTAAKKGQLEEQERLWARFQENCSSGRRKSEGRVNRASEVQEGALTSR